jgi:hypothetical protein
MRKRRKQTAAEYKIIFLFIKNQIKKIIILNQKDLRGKKQNCKFNVM